LPAPPCEPPAPEDDVLVEGVLDDDDELDDDELELLLPQPAEARATPTAAATHQEVLRPREITSPPLSSCQCANGMATRDCPHSTGVF
jgi:hypothetical protein